MDTNVIFDAYGRYVDLEALRSEKSAPTVSGIRQPLGGHPAQGLTPKRLASLLLAAEQGQADSYLELAEEMEEKDLHYAAVLASRKRAVSWLPITVESASDKPEDVKATEIIEKFLTRDDLKIELFHIMDAIAKGYSVTEIVWETDNDLWLPKKLAYRNPTFFEFDRLGEELLLRTEEGPKPLDRYKYIVHKSITKSGLPIRSGLARAASWAYMFKNFTIKAWSMFLEVFGLPFRVGKYGQSASKEDQRKLLYAVKSIASDAACIIPDNMIIEFINGQASGEGTTSFAANTDYWDKQISKLVLGQTGTTDTGQYVGTSDAHQATQFDIEESDAVQLAATLNRDLIRPIVDLNLGQRSVYPRLRIAREKREDLTALVNQIAQLVPFGLEVEESTIRDKLGLPEPARESKLLTAPAQPMGAAAPFGFSEQAVSRPDEDVLPVPIVRPEALPTEKPTAAEPVEQGQAPLNGPQIQAIVQVVQQVVLGALPRASGLGILTMGFGLSDQEAEKIMATAGNGFVPTGGEPEPPKAELNSAADNLSVSAEAETAGDELEENRSLVQTDLEAEGSGLEFESLVGPAMSKIFELAEKCETHEELKEAILKLAAEGGLDMEALGEDLAAKMFMATLGGAGIK